MEVIHDIVSAKPLDGYKVDVEGHLVGAEGVGQGEGVDTHRLELCVGLEPVGVGGLQGISPTGRTGILPVQHIVEFLLRALAVRNLQLLALLQLGEVAVHRTAAGQVRPHLALHARDDALEVDDLREVGGGYADRLAQGGLEIGRYRPCRM